MRLLMLVMLLGSLLIALAMFAVMQLASPEAVMMLFGSPPPPR